MDAVKAWGEEASKARQKAAEAAQSQGARGGLVIRIFGRWPAPFDWVNIANLPLVGDWPETQREQGLRLLLPAAKDVQDLMKSWFILGELP
eukprot:symbB.v1.2.019738.t1/scaffold1624.1/size108959/3